MNTATNIVNFELTKGLQPAFKSIIIPLKSIKKGVVMPSAEKAELTNEERAAVLDPFSNPEGFVSLWEKAGARAVKKATEENAALGIDSPCTRDGKTGYVTPNGKFVASNFIPK